MLQATEPASYAPVMWATSIVAVALLWAIRSRSGLSQFPLATEKSVWDVSGRKAKESFTVDARGVVERGLKQFGSSRPFRVISELGEMLIFPPAMANDVRNIENFSFAEYMKESTCAHLPGFEPFHEATRSSLLNDMVKTKLTQSLGKLTDPLSEETASACAVIFPPTKEWHEVGLKDGLLDLVARLSARTFLGDEVIDNASWLRITKNYTVDSFLASYELRTYPKFLQHIVHWFLPRAKKVRAQLKEAESIMRPVMERRRAERVSSPELAEKSDTIEWTEQIARERKLSYYPAAFQLNLAVSAIHTTTDLLAHTMYCLLQNSGYIPPLREEIISVVADGGLRHSSLYKLKLMDSVIKEAQRLKPPMSVNMNRVAMCDTHLPDGTLIPKGTKVGVSCQAMWDSNVFPEPEKFDGYRFLRLREQPGNDNVWQLTTTRPEHIAFGHGRHACPGRFLAANEIKIALCHLLLKYEWQLGASSPPPRIFSSGIMMDSDPTVKVGVRGRRAEVDL